MTVNGRFRDGSLRLVLTPVWILLSAIGLLGLAGVRFNWTASLPRGLYIITNDANAALVEFCPEGVFSVLSVSRGYRPHGVCPDRAAPLLKPVIARPGDTVAVSEDGLSVNGRPIENTKARRLDSAGRPLEPWPLGVYSVRPATVWVASTYHPNSFDSRYFGPIGVSMIRHRLRPLWVFGSTSAGW
jgi:conjugative transfer signal peptidase TraF